MTIHVNIPDQLTPRQARLLALADYIERDKSAFNMGSWDVCIAGKCRDMIGDHYGDASDVATKFLRLSSFEAYRLFTPRGDVLPKNINELYPIDKRWAVATLRHLAFTGAVDWQATRNHPAIPAMAG